MENHRARHNQGELGVVLRVAPRKRRCRSTPYGIFVNDCDYYGHRAGWGRGQNESDEERSIM